MFCALMMFYFDKRAQRILQRDEASSGNVNNKLLLYYRPRLVCLSMIMCKYNVVGRYWELNQFLYYLSFVYHCVDLAHCAVSSITVWECCFYVVGELIKLSDVKDFGAKFWLLCVICVTYYVTVFPFISLALWALAHSYINIFLIPFTDCCWSFCFASGMCDLWCIAVSTICICVCPFTYPKNYMSKLNEIFCKHICYLWPTISCVIYFLICKWCHIFI